MANFAKIGMNGKVIQVVRLEDGLCHDADGNEVESIGAEYLENLTSWPREMWKKTSYNTHQGVYIDRETNEPHADQSKAFRKNVATIGCTYDEDRDAFITPKIHNSWVLNETTCSYEAPVTRPTYAQSSYTKDGSEYIYKIHWDEANQKWVGERLQEDPITAYDWNPSTSSWDAQ
tara:strand:+ start:1925 stop:2449 length:525 start_codon:yes stop_codon:yes gene_type:complete